MVIDVWGSWCGPCIYDFKESYNFKKQLIDSGELEWVYFSLDGENNKDKWIEKSNELKSFGTLRNQYLIDADRRTEFSTFFNIDNTGIPIYIFFNENEELILPNGPPPSADFLFFERAIEQIY